MQKSYIQQMCDYCKKLFKKYWKTKPKVHAKCVKLVFLLSVDDAMLDCSSRPSIKEFVWFHQTGFRFNKSLALNWKILNRFRFGLTNRLHP